VLGEPSQAELADALGIDRSNLATIAAELCDRGLAERRPDEVDRPRHALRPSPPAARPPRDAPGASPDAAADTPRPPAAPRSASSSTACCAGSPTASSCAPRARTPTARSKPPRSACARHIYLVYILSI